VKLISFTVEGYRRFVDKTSLKLYGDMVALIGPNEVGKSSLLAAMAHLNSTEPFRRDELPRRGSTKPRLAWQFELDAEDRELLKDIPEAANARRVTLTKGDDAKTTWAFGPTNPRRDLRPRALCYDALLTSRPNIAGYVEGMEDAQKDELLAEIDEAIEELTSESQTLGPVSRQEIAKVEARLLEVVDFMTPIEGDDDELSKSRRQLSDLAAQVADLIKFETVQAPFARARAALSSRVPSIFEFKDEDRDLQSTYDLMAVAEAQPPALQHLTKLADLDLIELRNEVELGHEGVADWVTRLSHANAALKAVFDASWNQSGVAIQLALTGNELHIQASTPGDSGVSSITERSQGMRWFASLIAFAHGWTKSPILLLDEIETHLHYDAQSDLIDVLAAQQFTSKVIYTTHSVGCLPYDLGTGVRVVKPIDDARSRLANGFWDSGAGFTPLMAAMGAASASLTPARKAVIGEGASEMVLLPTVLRRANRDERLDFQVAPGLATVAPAAVSQLDQEAGQVAYFVDGDSGGDGIRAKLIDAGISETRIVSLVDQSTGDPLIFEDLINQEFLAEAWNQELSLWQNATVEIGPGSFDQRLCLTQADAWAAENGLRPPDKKAIGERIVELTYLEPAIEDGGRSLVRESQTETAQWLLAALREAMRHISG